MNTFYNKTKKFGIRYKNYRKPEFTWSYIKDFYARQAPFFDDKSYPWLKSGINKKTNYKIRYLEHLKLIQIAFEESNGNFDWFINMLFVGVIRVKPYKNMPVVYKTHAGFTASYKSIQDELIGKIKDICKEHEVTDIEIFGWSYGGAMTQLCLEDLTYRFIEKRDHLDWFRNKIPTITGMTIGAPRVFYKTDLSSWNKIQKRLERLIMIANVNDLITHLPPSIFGSKHIMPLYGVGKPKHMTFGIFNPWKYHLMTTYTKEINSQEDK